MRPSRAPWGDYGLADERYAGYEATDSVSSIQGHAPSSLFSTLNDQPQPPQQQQQQLQQQQQHTTTCLDTVVVDPEWAVANDIFRERYASVGPCDGRAWRPLPHLSTLSGQCSSSGFSTSDRDTSSKSGRNHDLEHDIPSMEPLLWRKTRQSVVNGEEFGLFGPREPWLTLPLHPLQGRGAQKQGESPLADPLQASTASQQPAQRPILFQYKPYEHQEPLNLTDAEKEAVLEASFGRSGSKYSAAGDVAPVILIKLIMDLYLRIGPADSFPIVLSMLEPPSIHGDDSTRERVFDLIINLLLHGDLLFQGDDKNCLKDTECAAACDVLNTASIDAVEGQEAFTAIVSSWPPLPANDPAVSMLSDSSLPALRQAHFHQWLRMVLFHVMDVCYRNCSSEIQLKGRCNWAASAVSCLAVLCIHQGKPVRGYLDGLSLSVVAFLLELSRKKVWPTQIRCWLGSIAADLLYTDGVMNTDAANRSNTFADSSPLVKWEETTSVATPNGSNGQRMNRLALGVVRVDAQRLEAFGGPFAVAKNYILAPTLQCKRAFFCIMFDIVTGRIHWPKSKGDQNRSQETFLWTLPQGRMAHPSEVTALGSALVHTRAAEALWCLLPLALNRFGDLAPVVEELRSQMAAVHSRHPELGIITSAPPAFVADCLGQLARMAWGGAAEKKEVTLSTVKEDIAKFCAGSSSVPLSEDCEFTLSLKIAMLLVERADGRVMEIGGSALGEDGHKQVLLPEDDELTDALTHALTQPSGSFAFSFAVSVCHALHALRLRVSGLVGPSVWQHLEPNSKRGELWLSIATHAISRAMQWIVSLSSPTPSRTLGISQLAQALVSAVTIRHEDRQCSCCSLPLLRNDTVENSTGGGQDNNHNAFDNGAFGLAQPGFMSPSPKPEPETLPQASIIAQRRDPLPPLEPQRQAQPLISQQRPRVEVQSFGPLSSGLASLSQPSPRVEGSIVGGQSSIEHNRPAMAGRPLAAAWRRLTRSGNESQHQKLQFQPQHQPQQGGNDLRSNEEVNVDVVGDGLVQAQAQAQASPQSTTFKVVAPLSVNPFSLRNLAALKAEEERQVTDLMTAKTLSALEILEGNITPVESLLAGLALLPASNVNLLTLDSLRLMFDALDIQSLISATGLEQTTRGVSGIHSGIHSGRSPSGIGHHLSVRSKAASVAGVPVAPRPLLDIRASIAVLFLKKADETDRVSSSSPISPSFLEILLADPDPRVRRHAAKFALRRFSSKSNGEAYHAALREIIGKAQRTDNDRTILLPEAQVSAFLDVRALRLDDLFENAS